MNRGPLDLQSNALPLSYTPIRGSGCLIIGICSQSRMSFSQFESAFPPESITVFLEQMCNLRAFLERNPQIFASMDQLK